MTDNLLYVFIFIGLIVFLAIVLFLLRKKKQEARRQLPTPSQPTLMQQEPPIEDVQLQPKISQSEPSSNEERLRIARNYIKQKKYNDAQVLLDQGLTTEPTNGQYMLELLKLYALTTQTEKFDAMYQSIQTQADMVMLRQAKDIKQEYAGIRAQSMDEPVSIQASQVDNRKDNIPITEDLVFDFEDELSESELSIDSQHSTTDQQNSGSESTFIIADDELTLTPEFSEEIEAESSDTDEILFTFDELEDDFNFDDDISTANTQPVDPQNIQQIAEPNLELTDFNETLKSEDDFDFDFDDDISTANTQPVDPQNIQQIAEPNLELTDFSETSKSEDNVAVHVESNAVNEFNLNQFDPTTSIDSTVSDDDALIFQSDLDSNTKQSSQTVTSPTTEQDLVSADTLDFFDNVSVDSSDKQAFSPNDADESDNETVDTLEFEYTETDSDTSDFTKQVEPTLDVLATDVNATDNDSISRPEDFIFNESMVDTVSQLEALDFNYDESVVTNQPTHPEQHDLNLNEKLFNKPTTSDHAPVIPAVANSTVDTNKAATDSLQTDADFNQAFSFVEQLDKSQITLDLAEQYLDLGEYDSAKRLVKEVINASTSETHKVHATKLLERMR